MLHNTMMSIILKPWGREYLCYRNEEVAIWLLEIKKGASTSLHAHPKKNTALIVLHGSAELSFIRGEPRILTGLDKINIFRGRFHRTTALGYPSRQANSVILLEVEAPDDKRDLVRLDDVYGRAGTPIEEATEPKDLSCLEIADNRETWVFAKCLLKIIHPISFEALSWQAASTIFVTLRGGLERGLVPPGDAIDGITMERLVRTFPPIPGSAFLQIWKWSIP